MSGEFLPSNCVAELEDHLQRYSDQKGLFEEILADMAEESEMPSYKIAESLNISPSTFSRYANGERTPDIEILYPLRRILELDAFDESTLYFARMVDRCMDDICSYLEQAIAYIKAPGHTLSEDELKRHYHQTLVVVRSMLTPYNSFMKLDEIHLAQDAVLELQTQIG